jgi:hypothetical protein
MKNGDWKILPKLNVKVEQILLSLQAFGMFLSVSFQDFFQFVEFLIMSINLNKTNKKITT